MEDLVCFDDLRCMEIKSPCLKMEITTSCPLKALKDDMHYYIRNGKIKLINGKYYIKKEDVFFYETGYKLMDRLIRNAWPIHSNRFYYKFKADMPYVLYRGIGVFRDNGNSYKLDRSRNLPNQTRGIRPYKLDTKTKLACYMSLWFLPNELIKYIFEFVEFANFRLEERIIKISKFEYKRKGLLWKAIKPRYRTKTEEVVFDRIIPNAFLWDDLILLRRILLSVGTSKELDKHLDILLLSKKEFKFRSLKEVQELYR